MKHIFKQVQFQERPIIICKMEIANYIKIELSKKKEIHNISFKTFQEATDDVLGFYHKESVFSYATKHNIDVDAMQTFLKSFSFLSATTPQTEKFKYLNNLQKELSDAKRQSFLKKLSYEGRNIIVIEEDASNDMWMLCKAQLQLIGHVSTLSFLELENNCFFYSFVDARDEVYSLVRKIATLLHNKVSADNIKIHLTNPTYKPVLEEVFSMFSIDITFNEQPMLYTRPYVLAFLKAMQNNQTEDVYLRIQSSLESAKKIVPFADKGTKQQVIDIINQTEIEALPAAQINAYLKNVFMNTRIKSKNYINTIEIGDFMQDCLGEDVYLFVPSCTQGVVPRVIQDDEYLLDKEKEGIGMISSSKKNEIYQKQFVKMIKRSKETVLSFADRYVDHTFVLSSAVINQVALGNIQPQEDSEDTIRFSKTYDQMLYAKLYDDVIKYDVIDPRLHALRKSDLKLEYRSYNNQFKGMDQEDLCSFLTEKLSLSYTSLDLYYNCPFAFYVEKVLRIRKNKNELAIFVGNMFHHVLEEMLLKAQEEITILQIQECMQEFCRKNNNPFGVKMHFFMEKHAQDLYLILQTIQTQLKQSSFVQSGFEEQVSITLENDYQTKLSGKIDKLLTYDLEGKTYAVVLDYKTGNTDFDYHNLFFGLNMQTLIYFYLYHKVGRPYQFGGAYLQRIFINPLQYEKNTTKEELLWKQLQWSGYTQEDQKVMFAVDNQVMQHTFLNRMRIKTDETLYDTAKKWVISDEIFHSLLKFVDGKIYEALENIENGDFSVAPIRMDDIDACKYCSYQDLCFKQEKNYRQGMKVSSLSILEKAVKTNEK